jgi:hypothetical protein
MAYPIDLEAKREEVWDGITNEQIVEAYNELPDEEQLTAGQMVSAIGATVRGLQIINKLQNKLADAIMERTDWQAEARQEAADARYHEEELRS